MNDIFLDDVINTVIGVLWKAGGLASSMWTAKMNAFAYGHS